ncbi:MAG TPA: VOC family protein [Thermoanaerobaculia bacterium]|nr:VOC family protein [Thermoanaerobaculia bacterium]
MRRRLDRSIVLCAALALGSQVGTAPAGAQELGSDKGVDHTAVLVRPEDFEAARGVFSEQLGFSLTPALLSPLGAKNSLIWFDDLTYLEILTFTELNDFTAQFLAFLENHQGGKFYGNDVVSAAQALGFLNAAGYPSVGPIPAGPLTIESTGEVLGLTPLWSSIILTTVLAPDNSLFFLDYDEAQVQQMFADFPAVAPQAHANTAERIETLFLVVADLDAAIAFYEGLGLEVRSRHRKVHYLGGRGAEVRYASNNVLLLEPDGPGIVADFAAERGEGILGVRLEVGDLQTARHLIHHSTGHHLPVFKHQGRHRFLLPTSLTNDFLIEMVE